MSWNLRNVEDLETALQHAPLLDRCAAEAHNEFSDSAFPDGANAAFLNAEWDAQETLLVLAEAGPEEPRPPGICLVGGLTDPLLRTRTPLVLVLHVAQAHRHQGLARSMVAHTRAAMLARGLPVLGGRVGHNDDALISMGERWGFLRHWELMLHE